MKSNKIEYLSEGQHTEAQESSWPPQQNSGLTGTWHIQDQLPSWTSLLEQEESGV